MENNEVAYSSIGSSMNLNINLDSLPVCSKCGKGVLLPLSDETKDFGNLIHKGWVCSFCQYNIMLRYGKIASQTEIVQIDPEDSRKTNEL